jgi:hypothetical protein
MINYTHAHIADQASGPGVTSREPLLRSTSASIAKPLSQQRESLEKLDERNRSARFGRWQRGTIFFG